MATLLFFYIGKEQLTKHYCCSSFSFSQHWFLPLPISLKLTCGFYFFFLKTDAAWCSHSRDLQCDTNHSNSQTHFTAKVALIGFWYSLLLGRTLCSQHRAGRINPRTFLVVSKSNISNCEPLNPHSPDQASRCSLISRADVFRPNTTRWTTTKQTPFLFVSVFSHKFSRQREY